MTTTTAAPSCCPEYAAVSRRGLLTGAAALAGASVMVGSAQVRASAASLTPAPSVMVVVSLRGAADGLSLVVPHGDPAYYTARPRIAIPSDRLLAKDGFFGLHPSLEPLLPLWRSGRLGAVHATGLPSPNRSHFSAMEEIEDASAGSATRVGWLNRLVGLDQATSPLQGISLGTAVTPTSMWGPAGTLNAHGVDDVEVAGEDGSLGAARRRSLQTLWGQVPSGLGRAARDAFAAVDDFHQVHRTASAPAGGASYPVHSDLGDGLRHAARIIRADVGVRVITVDHGDWDMHTHLGNADSGRMRTNTIEFARSLAAFFADIGSLGDKVTVVTVSEFGRRVVENANQGLDHGYGNVMFLAGAGVRGGQYYGRWPGLTTQSDSDLTVTTDYRTVLSEVVRARFGVDTSQVFPGFSGGGLGVMA